MDDGRTPTPQPPCPICGKARVARHAPFCSPRCADVDLGRWLKGIYKIETEEPADGEPGRPGSED
jgi:endogenous inhibitor of DNA gyrase (YacG/DUF329 family)